MSELERIDKVLYKTLAKNPNLRRKFLQAEIFYRWKELFPQFANSISPAKIQDETLILYSNDNALKDMLKFRAADFIQQINEKISPVIPIISDLKFGKIKPPKLIFPKKKPKKIIAPKFEEPELTAEEISECEKKVADVKNEIQRQILLETFLSYAKAEKRKLQRGWHKCKLCNSLCPPNDILCNVCTVKERERLQKTIRKIFCAAPETPFQKVQEKILIQFPYLQKECTLATIEFARSGLILQRAAKVSYGDSTSDAAIFLVCLIRQLPRHKLTQQIIDDTLKDFQFNLADLTQKFWNIVKKQKN